MKHAGLNKADLLYVSERESPQYLLLSEDEIAIWHCGFDGADAPDAYRLDMKNASGLYNTYLKALNHSEYKVTVNRRALISMLQMYDSETVEVAVGDDEPLVLEGSRKERLCRGVIAPVYELEDD